MLALREDALLEAFSAPGLDANVRVRGERVTGSALVVDGAVVHAELFASGDGECQRRFRTWERRAALPRPAVLVCAMRPTWYSRGETPMQKVLLTFVGFHDPFHKSAVEGEELKGPVLYLLGLRRFDRAYLFTGPSTLSIAKATAEAIGRIHPETEARVEPVDLDDPISYRQIIAGVRKAFRRIGAECDGADFSIATASGTPQMHAAWLLLAASGEIPAAILQTRPPQFVTTDRQPVEEIDLRPEFDQALCRLEQAAPQAAPGAEDLLREELGIVGRHPAFLESLAAAARYAKSPLPVLVQGDTGTGKELVATYIHRLSGLSVDRFHAVNCAGVPHELAESLLFGHRRGAFTGAVNDQKGAFDLANGGTLFLDEIGELAIDVQAKLLRVLQDGRVQPLGAPAPHTVTVRLVAATNRDLLAMVRERTFREDLYYRVEVGIIRLPPLRQRRSDIPLLAMAAIENANRRLSRPRRLTTAALQRLAARDWPGNVRGLLNVIERSVLLSTSEVIDVDALQFSDDGGAAAAAGTPEPHVGFDVQAYLDDVRRRLFDRALALGGGGASAAARLLGVTPQAVGKYQRAGEGQQA
jgi:DNA-binding NtrC family response regulator